jgi:hypothetical protein
MEKIIIKNLNDLIAIAEKDIMTPIEFCSLLGQCQPFVGIFLKEYTHTSEMALIMKKCISECKSELPIFWDSDIEVK